MRLPGLVSVMHRQLVFQAGNAEDLACPACLLIRVSQPGVSTCAIASWISADLCLATAAPRERAVGAELAGAGQRPDAGRSGARG